MPNTNYGLFGCELWLVVNCLNINKFVDAMCVNIINTGTDSTEATTSAQISIVAIATGSALALIVLLLLIISLTIAVAILFKKRNELTGKQLAL